MSKSLSVGTKAWADRINDAWQSSIDGILETGRILAQAKEALPKRDFERLIGNDLHFSGATARKLIIVASDIRLHSLGNKLSPEWTKLYELSQLSDDEFEQAVSGGEIKRDEIRRLRAPKAKQTVTEAEYEDVTESPPDGGGPGDDAVSVSGADNNVSHVVAADVTAPHDEREDGDSLVTEPLSSRYYSPPFPGMTPYWVDLGKPVTMISAGLALTLHGSRALTPAAAVKLLPDGAPSLSDVTDLLEWLYHFEKQYAYALADHAAAD